jgi:hypothetical protein
MGLTVAMMLTDLLTISEGNLAETALSQTRIWWMILTVAMTPFNYFTESDHNRKLIKLGLSLNIINMRNNRVFLSKP